VNQSDEFHCDAPAPSCDDPRGTPAWQRAQRLGGRDIHDDRADRALARDQARDRRSMPERRDRCACGSGGRPQGAQTRSSGSSSGSSDDSPGGGEPPSAAASTDETTLLAFLALVDQDSLGPAYTALTPDKQAAVIRGLEARYAERMLRRGMHPELVATMRQDAVALDELAAAMAGTRCWW